VKAKTRSDTRRLKTSVPVKEHNRRRIPMRVDLAAQCIMCGCPARIPNKRSVIGVKHG
jgi:hypothetical protein